MTLEVLLVDDHPIVREGLKTLLAAEDDIRIVGDVADAQTAVSAAAELTPDVIVMDLALPNVSGVDATKQIKSARPEAKVLILSAHREQRYVEQALAAGASGYVLKQTPGADLVHAVRAVASGATYLDPQVAPYVLPNARAQLSQREIEVMRMIALGHSMKEMSTALEVSPRTLETYRMRAMEKLGLKTRADIVRFALQSGWLATD